MPQANRVSWVDAAKGISILMVVTMYVAYSVGEDTGNIGFMHGIIAFATPFRMPEFFLISGLFLSKVIDRGWARFADRRVVHYLYFYGLWALIHILFKTAVATADPILAAQQAVMALVEPYGVLWFIYVLAMVGAAVKLMHMARIPHWLGFAAAAALQVANVKTGVYAIDQFSTYFVFFYSGYAFSPLVFKVVEKAVAAPAIAVFGLGAWAAINADLVFFPSHTFHPVSFDMGYAALPGVHLITALVGTLALCVAAGLLSRLSFMNWLTWLGSKSLVVYVSFALPMSAIRILLIKTGVVTEVNLMSLVVFAAALAFPLVLYWLVQTTGHGRFLFERPAWAHLPQARPQSAQSAVSVPAE